jgi:hypothetical protein
MLFSLTVGSLKYKFEVASTGTKSMPDLVKSGQPFSSYYMAEQTVYMTARSLHLKDLT